MEIKDTIGLHFLSKKFSYKSVLYCFFAASIPLIAQAEDTESKITIVDPQKANQKAIPAVIEGKHIEVGGYVGLLSVEDFNTNAVVGINLNYHFLDSFFTQFNYASSDTEKSNIEDTIDGNFVSDRSFDYYSIGIGYEIIRGRSFLGKNHKYNSGLYTTLSATRIDFINDEKTGFSFGLNYKNALSNWLTLDFNLEDHIVKRDFIGEKKRTHNIEFSVGLNLIY